MPVDRKRYPENGNEIAQQAKADAGWRCQHCQLLCLRPGEKHPSLTRSEWTKATLSVHHANFTPEDNQPENLIPLCLLNPFPDVKENSLALFSDRLLHKPQFRVLYKLKIRVPKT